MKLAPGTPLEVGLLLDEQRPPVPVGRLAMANGLAVLEWSPAAIAAGHRIDPIFYPAEPGLHAARGRTFEGLHGFLADSLPDAWGRLLMKRRLEKLNIRLEALSPVDRLALVGTRGRGALVYHPTTTPHDDVGTIDLDTLAEQSRAVILGDEGALVDTLAELGGASGGARPKVHVGFAAGGAISIGAGEIARDHEAWIVKFRAINDPLDIGAVEQAYAQMARAAGITVASSRLIPARDNPGYFATRRFDRPAPGQRLHMVSLAGAIEARPDMPSIDYDGFLRATLAITRHAADVDEAFRRMIFNILAHNRDDHSRQHSYLMGSDGGWRLAPAYDLTFSAGPGGEHYMAVEGEGRSPTRQHVMALGKRHGLSGRATGEIITVVREAISDWPSLAAELDVTMSGKEIGERLAQMDRTFLSA